jgi:hypothetical protein
MTQAAIPVSRERLEAFCRKWGVVELALFGSVLRADFGPDSDVDVLIEFAPDSDRHLWEWPDMQEELSSLFGRRVDLVSKRGLRNPFFRQRILDAREVVFAAHK